MSKLKHTKPFLAWHFVSDKLRDGRDIPADGVKLKQDGKLVMCQTGLHASRVLLDALYCAPGYTVCRVRISGDVIERPDKLVASERTIVWRAKVKRLISAFARQQALKVAHLWEIPDVVRQYLETGDESLRLAAANAAASAATSAAYATSATNAAAYAAAYATSAAYATASDAAYAAASAAYATASDAAAYASFKKSANGDLLKMINKARRNQASRK
jgi:hypothetical protein